MDSKFNGWENYETWAANLWLTNDQATYEYWREMAREVWRDAEATDILTRVQVARHDFAMRLKDQIEETHPCPDAGLYTDLLNAALSEVNWHEVADSFLEDIAEPETEADGG